MVVLQHGRELVELGEFNMGAAVYTTPVAHDGVLYVSEPQSPVRARGRLDGP